ncbi:MAG: DNA mismatch repair protein MutS [Treponema sp.]|jgi:DNA mismatch repair protein MutS|nr:DNA mismatch repair protein MutS [Treponema sp.]
MRATKNIAGGAVRKARAADNPSPMLAQYHRIKREHQGEVLFFRLGDFYEMFADDALEVSALLNLTLTKRNGLPMCGIPYHACRAYIARLLRHGKKIAICEQLSEPGKGLVDRKVIEVITPGTIVDEDYLDGGSANYLAALAAHAAFLAFAYIDLSTGDFFAASFPREEARGKLNQELERLPIREMIIQESLLEENAAVAEALGARPGIVLNRWADWLFDFGRGRERLEAQFGRERLKSFGLKETSPETVACGALLDYLEETSQGLIPHVRTLRLYTDSEFVCIDEATQRNLELVRGLQSGDTHCTLLEVMDETKTAMGRRLLTYRLLHPLRDRDAINKRLDMVDTLFHAQDENAALRGILARMPDLERLSARLAMDRAHGKDLAAVKASLAAFAGLADIASKKGLVFETPEAAALMRDGAAALYALRALLDQALAEEPAVILSEGNLIRAGYSAELDRLRALKDDGRGLLEAYLEEERLKTGISGLKVRYNRLLGYFFEVTKVNLGRVPAHFIRRQGMAGGERFSTERLAAIEQELNEASERSLELEKRLFLELREKAKALLPELAAAARLAAELDVAHALAHAAALRGWVRPEVDDSKNLQIADGRHPVVEAQLPSGGFVPNDLSLNAPDDTASPPPGSGDALSPPPGSGDALSPPPGSGDALSPPPGSGDALSPPLGGVGGGHQVPIPNSQFPNSPPVSFALITGPNMAGKSTYLRQAAILVIMAQAGSFVPARAARVGLVDRVFCRVGAQDNLARGESTFLVEMSETAYILQTATPSSLVIMDEVGRGTSAQDGLAIAWAVCEHLLDRTRCRTLFATHYHELTRLARPGLANRSMAVLDDGERIVFLRKVREGPAAGSYGLHVARLAGLPEDVLARAEVLMNQEKGGTITRENAQAFSPSSTGGQFFDRPPSLRTARESPWDAGALRATPLPSTSNPAPFSAAPQMEPSAPPSPLDAALASLDVDSLSPLAALNLLSEWKRRFSEPPAHLRAAVPPGAAPPAHTLPPAPQERDAGLLF